MNDEATDRRSLMEAEHGLLEAHRELIDDPCNGVEGLEGAACAPHIAELVRLAVGAAADHQPSQTWRGWIADELGSRAAAVTEEAEACMRASGLWPWPD